VVQIIPAMLVVGLLTLAGFYFGRLTRRLKLPSIIGFMVVGIIMGPSVLGLIDSSMEQQLSFITEISLAFIAFSIGLELKASWLRKQGFGIILVILGESFGAFVAVAFCMYMVVTLGFSTALLSNPVQFAALALLFGALAPASAPAGTVAVIQEYKAKGSLTQSLYAVVGFDDALAVIIFGFTLAISKQLLLAEAGATPGLLPGAFLNPLREVLLSLFVGAAIGTLFSLLTRTLKSPHNLLILLVGLILVANGLCAVLHLSFILTCMMFGALVANTQPHNLRQRIHEDLEFFMPLLFIFLFGLAGANLDAALLPQLGVIGVVYILARSAGLIGGASLCARIGKLEPNIQKYLGIGILSQAGVAIGFALIIRHDLAGIGTEVAKVNGEIVTSGDIIGSTALTIITATCVFFEIVGPILVKFALNRAGEIPFPPD